MATLTLRILTNSGDITKGSTLSSAELDQNLISLNNELKIATADIATAEGNISTLQTDLNTAETNITNLQTDRLIKNGTDTISGTVKVTGSIIYENNASSGYIPSPKGGQYQSSSSLVTGALKITLPTYAATDMISFWVDVYDYVTTETISIFISGYKYLNNDWINPTAIIYTKRDDKDLAVRFGGDGVNGLVWVGEVDTTWAYPQVIVRDVQLGYTADIDQYATGWAVSFVTAFDTVFVTETGNYPASKGSNTVGYSTTYTPSSLAYGGQHTSLAPYMSYITLSGSQYYPMVKTRATGATKTVNFSIGALHNSDNTIDGVLHRINGDGTNSKTIVRWIDSGAALYGVHVVPDTTNTYDLGTTALRWRNIYTQDLHLSNGIGDYTIVEGVENLYLVNNKTNKSFKFALIEVDPAEVPEKSKVT